MYFRKFEKNIIEFQLINLVIHELSITKGKNTSFCYVVTRDTQDLKHFSKAKYNPRYCSRKESHEENMQMVSHLYS